MDDKYQKGDDEGGAKCSLLMSYTVDYWRKLQIATSISLTFQKPFFFRLFGLKQEVIFEIR